MMERRYTFGELLRGFRERAGLTQEELAERIKGPRRQTISDWEMGNHKPRNRDQVKAIGDVLDLTAEEYLQLLDAAFFPRPRSTSEMEIVPEPFPVPQKYVYDSTRIIEDTARRFVGREFVFQEIERFIRSCSRGYLRIVADAGLGKTAIAATLAGRSHVLAHFFDERGGITAPRDCLKHLSAQLITRYGLPYADLPVESGENSAFLGDLLEEAVQRLSNDQRIVIVIDALDEADPVPAGHNWLHLPAHLPEGVYVILTHRPGDYMLSTDAGTRVEELVITWDDPRQTMDIEAYLWQAVEREEIYQVLEESSPPIPAERFVVRLREASEGNFMYLHFVLEDIAQGRLSPLRMEELPIGLRGYYARFWVQMEQSASDDEWYQLHVPVIESLAAAGEPVTARWLANYTAEGSGARVRRQVLRRWQRFLGRGKPVGKEKTWRIIHGSFADFMLEQEEVDSVRAHRRIADHYLADASLWTTYDGYAFRYLSAHLTEAGMLDELGELIERRDWYTAQCAYDTAGWAYARDVKLAIALAERQGKAGLAKVVGWSLLYATVCALATQVPLAALEAMVILGQIERALRYAEMITSPRTRAAAYRRIGLQLGKQGQVDQGREVLELALDAAERIGGEPERIEALVELVRALTEVGESDRAQAVATDIESKTYHILDPSDKVRVLVKLGRFERALRVAEGIWDEWSRGSAQVEVIQALAKLGELERGLALAEDVEDRGWRAAAFAGLARVLAEKGEIHRARDVLDRARASVNGVDRGTEHTWALTGIAGALVQIGERERARGILDQLLEEAEETEIENQAHLKSSIVWVLAQMGELTYALTVVESIEPGYWERDDALRAIAGALAKENEFERALAVTNSIRDGYMRVSIQAKIAQVLAEGGNRRRARDVLDGALAIQGIWYERAPGSAVAGKAMMTRTPDAKYEWARVSAVAGIARMLKEKEQGNLAKGMLDYASTLLEEIRGEGDRASVVADVGQALAEIVGVQSDYVVRWIVNMFRVARQYGQENVEEYIQALVPLLGELGILTQTWERIKAVDALLTPETSTDIE